MKLQFRNNSGHYMFSLINDCAYFQLKNLENDECFIKKTKNLNGVDCVCLVCIKNVTFIFLKFLEVSLSPGDYIKIII